MEASLSNTKHIDLPTTLPHSLNAIDICQKQDQDFCHLAEGSDQDFRVCQNLVQSGCIRMVDIS